MNQIRGMGAGITPETGTTRVESLLSRALTTIQPAWQTNAMIVDTAYAWNMPDDLSSIGMWIVRMGQGPYHSIYNPEPKDPNFDHLVNSLYQNGQAAVGGYYVIDPRYWNNLKLPDIIERDMKPLRELLDYKTLTVDRGVVKFDPERDSVNLFVLDFEIKNSGGNQMTASNLFYELPRVAEAAHARWPRLKIVVYCNGDMLYTPGLCPQLLPWINTNRDWLWFWGAKWCYNKLLPYQTMKAYTDLRPVSTFKTLKVGANYTEWDMCQYGGDNGTVVGVTNKANGGLTALDVTMYNGTKEILWAEVGFTPLGETTPPEPPEPVVMTHEEQHAVLWREAGLHGWNLEK